MSSKRSLIVSTYLSRLFLVAMISVIVAWIAPSAGMEGLAAVMAGVAVMCIIVIPFIMAYGFISSRISHYLSKKREADERS